MKKKSLNNLALNKKAISNFKQEQELKGGLRTVHGCSHLITCPLGICYDSKLNC